MSCSQSPGSERRLTIPLTFLESLFPGQRFALSFVFHDAASAAPRADNPSGAPGTYHVVLALHRPDSPLNPLPDLGSAEDPLGTRGSTSARTTASSARKSAMIPAPSIVKQ